MSIRADEVSGVNRARAIHVRRTPAGFFHDEREWREIPRLGVQVQRDLDGAFRDEHVLPEPAEGAAVPRSVEQPPHLFYFVAALAGPGAAREGHGDIQLRDVRNMNRFAIAPRAFAAIRTPACAERRSAGHTGYHLSVALDS